MNTATTVGFFISGITFGYVVKLTGSYDLPLLLIALVLAFGAAMWLKIDPTQELVPEGQSEPVEVQPPSPKKRTATRRR
jgi:hypothetical protein